MSKQLVHGKAPIDVLRKRVLRFLGARREDVILGPAVGKDAAILKIGKNVIAAACDPITGSRSMVGWLAVHINANDIAVHGIRPRWFSSCILMPPGWGEDDLEEVTKQIHTAAESLGIAVVTGHCETTPGLQAPIVVGHMMGVAEEGRFVTSGGGKPGDKVLMTKTAGIEGTAILARDFRDNLQSTVDPDLLDRAADFYKRISVVEEALKAFDVGDVSAMHDPTEGGVVGGIYEMAVASGCGFLVQEDAIGVAEETRAVCAFFGADPLKLIGSGALLFSVRGGVQEILEHLKVNGIPCSVIGELRPAKVKVVARSTGEERVDELVQDELWRILSTHSGTD